MQLIMMRRKAEVEVMEQDERIGSTSLQVGLV